MSVVITVHCDEVSKMRQMCESKNTDNKDGGRQRPSETNHSLCLFRQLTVSNTEIIQPVTGI